MPENPCRGHSNTDDALGTSLIIYREIMIPISLSDIYIKIVKDVLLPQTPATGCGVGSPTRGSGMG